MFGATIRAAGTLDHTTCSQRDTLENHINGNHAIHLGATARAEPETAAPNADASAVEPKSPNKSSPAPPSPEHASISALSQSKESEVDKPLTREHLESLTTLDLRAIAQPRGLKVNGLKGDLVFRLLCFLASESRTSGNRKQLEAFANGDLQRICRAQGLSISGTTEDLITRLMEPVQEGQERQEMQDDSDCVQLPNKQPPPFLDVSTAIRRRSVASPSASETVVAASSLSSTAASTAASAHRATSTSSSFSTPSSHSTRRLSKTERPSSSATAGFRASNPDQFSRNASTQPQPPKPKTPPRPQHASLDLYFPVPSDPIVAVTAPILLDTYPPPPADCSVSFTLIETTAPPPVPPFPAFVLPPPPRSFTQSSSSQRPPTGMSLSSCVVIQQARASCVTHPSRVTRHASPCLNPQVLPACARAHHQHLQIVRYSCSRRQPRPPSQV